MSALEARVRLSLFLYCVSVFFIYPAFLFLFQVARDVILANFAMDLNVRSGVLSRSETAVLATIFCAGYITIPILLFFRLVRPVFVLVTLFLTVMTYEVVLLAPTPLRTLSDMPIDRLSCFQRSWACIPFFEHGLAMSYAILVGAVLPARWRVAASTPREFSAFFKSCAE